MYRNGVDGKEKQTEERRAGISVAVRVAVQYNLRKTPDTRNQAGKEQ